MTPFFQLSFPPPRLRDAKRRFSDEATYDDQDVMSTWIRFENLLERRGWTVGGGWTQIRRVNDWKERVRLLGGWPGGCENSTGVGIFESCWSRENKSGAKNSGRGNGHGSLLRRSFRRCSTFDRAPASIVYPIPNGRYIFCLAKGD